MTAVTFALLVPCAAPAGEGAASGIEQQKASLEWRVERDEAGRPVKVVSPNGAATNIRYDLDERQRIRAVTKEFPDATHVQVSFDSSGRPVSMGDAEGQVHFEYDTRDRVVATHREGAPSVTFSYDTLDRRTHVQVGDFYRVTYRYDFLGRLVRMNTPAGAISYQYDTVQGIVTRLLPNDVKTYWKRQANGELEEIAHSYLQNPDDRQHTLLARYAYSRRPDGRIVTIRERIGREEVLRQFTYDTMGRLTTASSRGRGGYRYRYDLVGNRTRASTRAGSQQSFEYDWAGRVKTVNGRATRHDASGNVAALPTGEGTREYRYRVDGRLAEVRSGEETVGFTYDGTGHLIGRQAAGGETRFTLDGLSGHWQPLVVHAPDGARTLVVWDGATPLALVRDGDVQWLLHDHQGSVRLITDSRGEITTQYAYDPFGAPEPDASPETLTPGYAGLFWDEVAGGYLTLARTFIPQLGAFLQPDPRKPVPSSTSESLSLYSYCGADPVNFLDINGAARMAAEASVTQGQLSRQQTEIRIRQQRMMDRIRRQQLELQRRQQRLSDRIRRQQSDVSRRQQQMMDRMRRQQYALQMKQQQTLRHAQAVGPRQLRGAMNFRDQLLDVQLKTTVATGLNLYGNVMTVVPGLGGARLGVNLAFAAVGGMFKGSGEALTQALPSGVRDDASHAPKAFNTIFGAVDVAKSAYDFERAWSQTGSWKHTLKKYDSGTGKQHIVSADSRYSDELAALQDGFDSTINTTVGFDHMRDWAPVRNVARGIVGGQAAGYLGTVAGREISSVGGVYLGGAGRAIEDLGELQGVRLDSNGNLVLVGETGADIDLPPLRLDDVVTVFRSVYIDGHGPTVTIDPNPEDPEKSAMVVVNSEATRNTYVGWILYQADRLMKSYGQGVDNITQKNIDSKVAGYKEVLDTVYFGGSDPRAAQKGGIWERFWIVPAEARRVEPTPDKLTLFDVPLMVRTQKMKWEKDKLVDDTKGKSSAGAMAFSTWFTNNYDAIDAEQYLLPPPESGLTEPVPVFSELRRIALITALAEKLRDQGTRMPFWMYDYEVKPVPVDKYTPGMEVTRRKAIASGTSTARIFGGVGLSPETESVKTYATAADAAGHPDEEVQKGLVARVKLAQDLDGPIAEAVAPVAAEPLTVYEIGSGAEPYRAVAVPGAGTLAPAPAVLEEADLAIPVLGQRELRLVRQFNSFFDPKDLLGRGWTLNLPRLVQVRVPLRRERSAAEYATAYELLTPLNDLYGRFEEQRAVPELDGATLLVPDRRGRFYGLSSATPSFLNDVETTQLLLKDGQRWHFTEAGYLVAIEDGPNVTIYERGGSGEIPRILALSAGVLAAKIELEYTSEGQLARAVGRVVGEPDRKPVEVSYAYDPSERLVSVQTDAGALGYGYEGPRVASVTWTDDAAGAKPETVRAFKYNERGQIVSETRGSSIVQHVVTAGADGVEVSVEDAEGDKASTRYDTQMRLVEAISPDRTRALKSYDQAGNVETMVTTPDGITTTISDSADGRRRRVSEEGGPTLEAEFDAGGHLTEVSENGQVVLAQKWRRDGQLAAAETPDRGTDFQYKESGALRSLLLRPVGAGPNLSRWQETSVDRRGNPIQIKDSAGLDLRFAYDDAGALTAAVKKIGEANVGYQIERDDQGRPRTVKSSWGEIAYGYDNAGDIQNVRSKRGDQNASAEFAGGLVRTAAAFDGGITTVNYYEEGDLAGLVRTLKHANGLILEYEYDEEERITAVDLGSDVRVRLEYDAVGEVATYAWEPRGS